MENLNDVEFGVDENQEEAPILIAHRHLNIFRQVHIFNKAKRDQFDDELLALPEVVINYIKKMPGGRLLIEHLEDVKTKRGISFVKSSSEDFISPDDAAVAPQPSAGGVPTQYVGGSLTMDANFADTFAKSMAEAVKQMPEDEEFLIILGNAVEQPPADKPNKSIDYRAYLLKKNPNTHKQFCIYFTRNERPFPISLGPFAYARYCPFRLSFSCLAPCSPHAGARRVMNKGVFFVLDVSDASTTNYVSKWVDIRLPTPCKAYLKQV